MAAGYTDELRDGGTIFREASAIRLGVQVTEAGLLPDYAERNDSEGEAAWAASRTKHTYLSALYRP
jgi:hypothetical protein